ncbi:MAG: DegT/DnrJ/EryC1/StrS family aminotransferase [Promethearchaeota archaeon]
MKIPFFTSKYQDLKYGNLFREKINDVIKSGKFILGDEVIQFEKKISELTGAKHSIGVASGTDALYLSIKSLGLPEKKEIITTPFTFIASASSIYNNNLIPVFVDVDENTYNINPDLIEDKINDNTEAILPVDLFCQPADFDKINKIAKKYNLKIIEDSAEAFGMKWGDISAGLCGDIGVFSFFPTKTLGAFGDGGMVITNNNYYAQKIRSLRIHGANDKYIYQYIGINSRLDAIQAAILNVKLGFIEQEIKERERIYKIYKQSLEDIEEIQFPQLYGKAKAVWYVLNVKCKYRDELKMFLKQNGINTMIYYPKPLHLQECFKCLGYKKGDFPIAEKLSNNLLALPIYIGMDSQTIEYVCNTIKKFYRMKERGY